MYANTSPDRRDISEEVLSSLRTVLADDGGESGDAPNEHTCLIGPTSAVDSMGLVRLLADLEERLDDAYGVSLTLADERAMSGRTSPFRTVQSLTDYICLLMRESASHDRP